MGYIDRLSTLRLNVIIVLYETFPPSIFHDEDMHQCGVQAPHLYSFAVLVRLV